MPDLSPELLALGFIWYVAFLFSTTCHEAAHALAAKIGGDDTAFAGGQVSLNPVPHIQREPWGMVVFPILSLVVTGSLLAGPARHTIRCGSGGIPAGPRGWRSPVRPRTTC